MYEVRCMVSDTKLANVLTALKNLTFGLPSVLVSEDEAAQSTVSVPRKGYVAGKLKKQRKKPVFTTRKGQGATQIVRDLIAKTGATQITAREMRQAVEAVGYSKGSYSHAIKLLMAEGELRQVDSFGHYAVVRPATAVAAAASG